MKPKAGPRVHQQLFQAPLSNLNTNGSGFTTQREGSSLSRALGVASESSPGQLSCLGRRNTDPNAREIRSQTRAAEGSYWAQGAFRRNITPGVTTRRDETESKEEGLDERG